MSWDYVGYVNQESMMRAIAAAPVVEPKDIYVERELENLFGDYDWSKSFSSTQILIYDETLLSEILIILHKWLRRKCADIENITLVTTHNLGVASWWKTWCDTHHQQSFRIKELLFTDSPKYKKAWFGRLPELQPEGFYRKNKNISRLFSFYGNGRSGVKVPLERCYATLELLELVDESEIDFLGEFPSKSQLLDYVEHITYFKNQKDVDYIGNIYDRYVVDNHLPNQLNFIGTKLQNEQMTFDGLQWEVDRHCWAAIVRETVIDDVYATVTEKTLRAFLHHLVVMPVAYNAVSELEKIGFWFPHDIIDYSYQTEPLFATRIQRLKKSLKEILAVYSYSQLQEFYINNIKKFQHNVELVYHCLNKEESYI